MMILRFQKCLCFHSRSWVWEVKVVRRQAGVWENQSPTGYYLFLVENENRHSASSVRAK